MTHHPLADAAGRVVDALYALEREWEAEGEAALDRDPSGVLNGALHTALSEGFPFKEDLAELVSRCGQWQEHAAAVMANPPGRLKAAAQDIRALAAEVTEHLTDYGDSEVTEPVKLFRDHQLDCPGGMIGTLGAVLGLGIAEPLAKLLSAVEDLDPEAAEDAAGELATAVIEGRMAVIRRPK